MSARRSASAEVRELRAPRFTIGGSEAAAAVGIDPFRSRVMLWAEKTGRTERRETEAKTWGKRLEPLIVATLEDEGYSIVPAPADGYADPDLPWLTGRPDAFTVAVGGLPAVLEVKTANSFAWPKGAVPIHYQAQCQHYMMLTGHTRCVVAALVNGQSLEVHELERDDSAIATMRALQADFYEHLRRDTMPAPDGSDSARAAVVALFPEHAAGKLYRLTRDEWRDVRELRARREQRDAIAAQITELENRLKAAMGSAETAISPHDTEALHWRNVQAKRLDATALKEARLDVWEEFATVTTSRRFTVV